MTTEEKAILAAGLLGKRLNMPWRDLLTGCWLGIVSRPRSPFLAAARWGLFDLWRAENEDSQGTRWNRRCAHVRGEQLSTVAAGKIVDTNADPVGWELESEDAVRWLLSAIPTARARRMLVDYSLGAWGSMKTLKARYGLSEARIRVVIAESLKRIREHLEGQNHGTETSWGVSDYRASGDIHRSEPKDGSDLGGQETAPRSPSAQHQESGVAASGDAERPHRLCLAAWDSVDAWGGS